jgi:hypothetical protein
MSRMDQGIVRVGMNAVVFDAAHKWSLWLSLWLAGGTADLFVGFLLLRYARRQWLAWLMWLVFAVIWATPPGVLVRDHLAIRHALASGSYSVVEGAVENFHPMPHHGHTLEWFEVKGVRFRYSDFTVTRCFNNTTSHGGPIRAGLRVRLTYIAWPYLDIEHCILRLEILPSVSTSSPFGRAGGPVARHPNGPYRANPAKTGPMPATSPMLVRE